MVLRVGVKPEEPGPAYLQLKNAVTFTQTNGNVGPDGKLNAQVTVEALELNEEFAGNPRKGPDTSGVKGRVLVVTFDHSGTLVGIKVPPDMREVQSRLTQLLAGAYGMINFLPPVQLKVGEETITTTELPMRLPGNVSQDPLKARTTLTLRRLDKQGNDRIARLHQDISVDTATTAVQMTGGGTIDVNVDRGFVSSTDTEWKISGTLPAKTTDAAQAAPFYGSIKLSVTAH
jgi:hypothetical protein